MAVVKRDTADTTEYEMFCEYRRTRDKKLRDILVDRYMYIAEILSRKFINRGIEYDDIYQVACIGILSAVERFDPEKNIKFPTYATPTVLGEIRHYFRDKGSFIKVPRTLYEIFCKAERIRRSQAGEKITNKELARMLNLSEKEVQMAYDAGGTAFIQSLEDDASHSDSLMMSYTLGYEDNHFMMVENRDFIRYCAEHLTEKEIDFIKLRYYENCTQKEIADKWDMSQMHVSRLERNVLKKIRGLYFRD